MENQACIDAYYSKIFPSKELFDVLDIDNKRELSFQTRDSAYIRYQSFNSHSEFSAAVGKVHPTKIDIGAIHDKIPMKLNGAKAVAKELVFDIDLTDYPRTCCEGKKICTECYEKIKCAVKILDYSLRNEFGFRNIGFVFSGRRGVHCWVLDYKNMDATVRTEIFKFYQYIVDKSYSVDQYNEIMQSFAGSAKDMIKDWFIRIDKQVTTSLNHLIKAPFSVHPETGNIAIPLDPENITELEDIPTVLQVTDNPKMLEPYVEIMKKWKSSVLSPPGK
ncbi:DNA primase small subunit [Enteropsectra breve]|nr:DNA primase small subunit [Enteropsectra breve]